MNLPAKRPSFLSRRQMQQSRWLVWGLVPMCVVAPKSTSWEQGYVWNSTAMVLPPLAKGFRSTTQQVVKMTDSAIAREIPRCVVQSQIPQLAPSRTTWTLAGQRSVMSPMDAATRSPTAAAARRHRTAATAVAHQLSIGNAFATTRPLSEPQAA